MYPCVTGSAKTDSIVARSTILTVHQTAQIHITQCTCIEVKSMFFRIGLVLEGLVLDQKIHVFDNQYFRVVEPPEYRLC